MQKVLSPQLREAAQSLIDSLLASEAFMRYQKARKRIVQDLEVCTLLECLSIAESELRKERDIGSEGQKELKCLRSIQRRLRHNLVIREYDQSHREAVDLLRAINKEISQLSGIDFASFGDHTFTTINANTSKPLLKGRLPSGKNRRAAHQNIRSTKARKRVNS